MNATTEQSGQAPRTLEVFGLPEDLTTTGVASAHSHGYYQADHPGLVAFALPHARLTHEASLELCDLLDFLGRSLKSDAERDDALPAWRSITSRAAILARAMLGVLGGDQPSVAELAEQVHGELWPAFVDQSQQGAPQ